jgi:fumarylacetoacetate (FAA) hydrolase
MKLATLKDHSRDGQLVVVSRNLDKAVTAGDISPTMQFALDHWDAVSDSLNHLYNALNNDQVSSSFKFSPKHAMAPLPRAYQWLDASAYVNHVQLVRKSRGVEMPENFWTDPLMYQGASDDMLGACDPIYVETLDYGIDFEAEVAVFTDDVPMGVSPAQASKHIRFIGILNDISYRNLAVEELKKGFGFINTKPATAFSPVVVTPDELGPSWDGERVHLPLHTYYNAHSFGSPNAGVDMTFGFPQLIAHAAKTRRLTAGTIIGSGTVSNVDKKAGSSCIVEKRMLETLATGKPLTPFMRYGDSVKIQMLDHEGKNIFGDIQQEVKPIEAASAKSA